VNSLDELAANLDLASPARLPIVAKPLKAETLSSYLSRLAQRNRLSPTGWPQNAAKDPAFTTVLMSLTGFSERQLVSALPQMRTPKTLANYRYLIGTVSASASIRPACQFCVAAAGGRGEHAEVFRTHDQLICRRHRRWLGRPGLSTTDEQFSLDRCTGILDANTRHRRLIRNWGRQAARVRFEDSICAFQVWRRWSRVTSDPGIEARHQALGINADEWPMTPRDVASWYPNTVELTALLLQQTHAIAREGRITLDIVEAGIDYVATYVVRGLRPAGAWDPYLRALRRAWPGPAAEVEVLP
jgi:hypothetical protein